MTTVAANWATIVAAKYPTNFIAGALNLKARLTVANALGFTCGSANLDAEVLKAKKLKLFCGSAGGKLLVPRGTKLPWVPFWFGLRIVER